MNLLGSLKVAEVSGAGNRATGNSYALSVTSETTEHFFFLFFFLRVACVYG